MHARMADPMNQHFSIRTRSGELAHVVGDCQQCERERHDLCFKLLRSSVPSLTSAWFNVPFRDADAIGPALYACRCYAFGQCQPPAKWRWFGWWRKDDWRLEI